MITLYQEKIPRGAVANMLNNEALVSSLAIAFTFGPVTLRKVCTLISPVMVERVPRVFFYKDCFGII